LHLCSVCMLWCAWTGGWIHGVSFSKDGSHLAWVSHDSCITVADAANDSRLHAIIVVYLLLLLVIALYC